MGSKKKSFPQRLYLYKQGLSDREIAEKIGVCTRTICSWRNSKNIPPHESNKLKCGPCGPERKWTDEELLDILRENPDLSYLELYDKLDGKEDMPSSGTIADRFGSWNKARKKIGLETNKPKGLNPPSEEEKIEKVKKAMEEGNREILKKYPKIYLKYTDGWAEEIYQEMTGKELRNKN